MTSVVGRDDYSYVGGGKGADTLGFDDGLANRKQPIFFMYEVPDVAPVSMACGRMVGIRQDGVTGEIPGTCPLEPASGGQISRLIALWTRLRTLPRGAHKHLVQATEGFVRAAMVLPSNTLRCYALQSALRELDRQHAALATRLSRDLRACPYALTTRDQIVCLKRHVRSAVRDSIVEAETDGFAVTSKEQNGITPPSFLPSTAQKSYREVGFADVNEDALHDLKELAYTEKARCLNSSNVIYDVSPEAAAPMDDPLAGLRELAYNQTVIDPSSPLPHFQIAYARRSFETLSQNRSSPSCCEVLAARRQNFKPMLRKSSNSACAWTDATTTVVAKRHNLIVADSGHLGSTRIIASRKRQMAPTKNLERDGAKLKRLSCFFVARRRRDGECVSDNFPRSSVSGVLEIQSRFFSSVSRPEVGSTTLLPHGAFHRFRESPS